LGKWGEEPACLVIFSVHIPSAHKKSSIEIVLRFSPEHGLAEDGVPRRPVIIHAQVPDTLYGEPIMVNQGSDAGVALGLTVGLPAAQITASGQGNTNKSSSNPQKETLVSNIWYEKDEINVSMVKWTIKENKASKNGVPSNLRLATVVQYKSNKGLKVSAQKSPGFLGRFRNGDEFGSECVITPESGDKAFKKWKDRHWVKAGVTCALKTK
jgi:hypothetical protein